MKPVLELVYKDYTKTVSLAKVFYLHAQGSYTDVVFKESDGQLASHTQSKHLKTFEHQLDERFLLIRRGCIINLDKVDGYYHNRTIKLCMPNSPTFVVPKAMWKHVKAVISGKKSNSPDQDSTLSNR